MQIQLFPLHYSAFYQLSDFFNSKTELKSTAKIFSLSSIAHVPCDTHGIGLKIKIADTSKGCQLF